MMHNNQSSSALAVPAMRPVAPQAVTLSQDLHEWLGQQSYDVCYLLVDPQLRAIEKTEPLGYALEQCALASPQANRYTVTLPITKEHSPWFMPLDVSKANDSHAVALSIEDALDELVPQHLIQGLGRRIGGWMVSQARDIDIGKHLSSVMVQTAPGGISMLLRIHDNSVLWLLWAVLTPVQKNQLLGPILHWFIVDISGQMVRLDRPDDQEQQEPLRLTTAQWADVANMQAINNALALWAAQRPPEQALRANVLHQAAQTVIAAARRANAIGLKDTKDISLFAQHALQHGSAFDSHPDIAALLTKCDPTKHTDPDRYSSAVDGLSADDWSRIARETQGITA